jgi:hypothetical protein
MTFSHNENVYKPISVWFGMKWTYNHGIDSIIDYKFITLAHSHFGRNRSTNSLIPVSKRDFELKNRFYDANLVITWSRNPHAKTPIPKKLSKSGLIGVWHKDNLYPSTSTIENGDPHPTNIDSRTRSTRMTPRRQLFFDNRAHWYSRYSRCYHTYNQVIIFDEIVWF